MQSVSIPTDVTSSIPAQGEDVQQYEITQFELREFSNILSSSTIYCQQYYFYNYINVIYEFSGVSSIKTTKEVASVKNITA
jgi:hypothetical protein